jgi:hypothetical protein
VQDVIGEIMNQDQLLIDIHEKVTKIRLDQVSQKEKIADLEKDRDQHSKDLEKLKANHNKIIGAGIFVSFSAIIVKIWEGVFG